jgi:hypothetical protein
LGANGAGEGHSEALDDSAGELSGEWVTGRGGRNDELRRRRSGELPTGCEKTRSRLGALGSDCSGNDRGKRVIIGDADAAGIEGLDDTAKEPRRKVRWRRREDGTKNDNKLGDDLVHLVTPGAGGDGRETEG